MSVVTTGQITITDQNDGVSARLTLESFVAPTAPDGSSPVLTGASTTVSVFLGATDDSSNWTVVASPSSGVTGSLSARTYTVSGLTVDAGYVDLTASRSGYSSVTMRFAVSKAKKGNRGTVSAARAISGAAWSDSEAAAAITAVASDSPVQGDVVTLYNSASAYSETRQRGASSWSALTKYLNGNLVVDGTVSAGAIAADAITASKMLIEDNSNIAPDADYEDAGAWVLDSASTTETVVAATSEWNSSNILQVDAASNVVGIVRGKTFKVRPGDKLFWEGQLMVNGGTGNCYVQIQYSASRNMSSPVTTNTAISSATVPTTLSGEITVPAGVRFARVRLVKNSNGTTSALFGRFVLRKKADAELIVDGAITTEKLAVGSSNNTIHNSQFYGALSGWNARNYPGNTGVMSIRAAGSTWTKPGCPVLQVYQPDGGTVGYVDVRNQRVGETGEASFGTPVKEGSAWEASAYTSAHRCIVELRIEWRNLSGAILGYSPVSTNSSDFGSSTDPDQWVRLVSRGIAPAGAAYAVFHIRKRATNSGASQADSFMMVHKPLLGETVPNASVAMEWSPGGWTLISGDAILTGSVNADRIVAGSITATQINAGAIGAEQLAANAVSARHLAVGNFVNLFDGADSFETSPFRPASAAYGGNGIWDTTTTYNGQTSIGINADFGGGTAYVVRDIPVIPGASYYIEFQARRSADWNGAVNNSKLRIANQTGTLLTAIDYSAATVGTAWTKRSLTYTVPSGVTKLRISLVNDATAGWVRLAGFVMRERGGGELLVDGAITADHVDAVSFGASGLALFGGELRSTNFVQGSTGWRIKNDGTAELESLIVRTRHLEDNAVTTLRTATGASTVVSNDFLTTVASLTFTPFGANMVVWLRFTANLNAPTSGTNSLLYQLRWRGVNQISDWVFNVPVGSSLSETVSDMWLIQVPGNTSGTLLLQARTGNSAGGTVSNGLLVVGEFKK
jgi:hypothetical protein